MGSLTRYRARNQTAPDSPRTQTEHASTPAQDPDCGSCNRSQSHHCPRSGSSSTGVLPMLLHKAIAAKQRVFFGQLMVDPDISGVDLRRRLIHKLVVGIARPYRLARDVGVWVESRQLDCNRIQAAWSNDPRRRARHPACPVALLRNGYAVGLSSLKSPLFMLWEGTTDSSSPACRCADLGNPRKEDAVVHNRTAHGAAKLVLAEMFPYRYHSVC